ncbi:MAG: glycosyltransferase family protein [Patescibacteria group bacterium]|nr:glycosyltransferase family protein [Patescibacteria group bacterium]
MAVKNLCIIQARYGSNRLPGKVLLPLGGKTVIEQVISRVGQAKKIDHRQGGTGKIILATTTKEEDDALEKICPKAGVDCFRGSEDDVLDRYYQAAKKFKAENIIRITGDCPLIDPEIIDKVVDLYEKSGVDYATNVIPPTFPDGLDTEIFSFAALEKAWRETNLASQREHVTIYLWQNPEIFKQIHLKNDINLSKRRWVLDNPEDYEFMKLVYSKLYPAKPNFNLADLLKFFADNPEIEKINNMIKRNEGLKKSLEEDKIIKK